MNPTVSYVFIMLRNHFVGFFQQRWVQVLIVALLLMSLYGLVHHYRSSYVAVELADAPGIPPDPGRRKANSTLLGVDSDNDGIRDDVQRYILALEIDHPFYKRAQLQYAEAVQLVLASRFTPEQADDARELLSKASGCARSATGAMQWSHDVDSLMDIILNTRKRRSTYRNLLPERSYLFSATFERDEEMCNFDVNNFDGERRR